MRKSVLALVLFSVLALSLGVPAAAGEGSGAAPAAGVRELWLGVGALAIPERGNLAYSTGHQELQASAGFYGSVGKRWAFAVQLATDTVDAQAWLRRHNFTVAEPATWSARYYALDAEAHLVLTPQGSGCRLSAFVGPTLYHADGADWGGVKAGVAASWAFTRHLALGGELAVRHSGAGPFGDYTVPELALRLGWRF